MPHTFPSREAGDVLNQYAVIFTPKRNKGEKIQTFIMAVNGYDDMIRNGKAFGQKANEDASLLYPVSSKMIDAIRKRIETKFAETTDLQVRRDEIQKMVSWIRAAFLNRLAALEQEEAQEQDL